MCAAAAQELRVPPQNLRVLGDPFVPLTFVDQSSSVARTVRKGNGPGGADITMSTETETPRDEESAQARHWHALSADEVLRTVQSIGDRGLSSDEAHARLSRSGPSSLQEPEHRSLVAIFLGQFRRPLIYLRGAQAVGPAPSASRHLSVLGKMKTARFPVEKP